MEFNEKLLKDLAKKTGLNDKGIKRVLGSIPVSTKGLTSDSEGSISYDLGLRLNTKDLFKRVQSQADKLSLEDVIIDYRNNCAHVVNWIMRGDFNPTNIPAHIPKSALLHASRTIGRLRAAVLRSLYTRGE